MIKIEKGIPVPTPFRSFDLDHPVNTILFPVFKKMEIGDSVLLGLEHNFFEIVCTAKNADIGIQVRRETNAQRVWRSR